MMYSRRNNQILDGIALPWQAVVADDTWFVVPNISLTFSQVSLQTPELTAKQTAKISLFLEFREIRFEMGIRCFVPWVYILACGNYSNLLGLVRKIGSSEA
ncbi:hypothetical protein BTVI_149663 [Pitangus sulphuratus]|nr:hypothetical protein BTVI_149663 [Pitangus sulphuratus]